MSSPLVSVIMSVYKEPKEWIILSINSILTQTLQDFEFIVVCDNPDYSIAKELILDYHNRDKRLRYIFNEENIGLTKSLNKALSVTAGKYIARMDADDVSLPDRLQQQVLFLESNPGYSICSTDTDIINDKGDIIRRHNYKGMYDQSWLFWDNPIAHSTVMMRRNILAMRNPLYNEQFKTAQDFELWQYLLLHDVKFHVMKETHLLYRKSSQQISKSQGCSQQTNSKNVHRNLIKSYLLQNNFINRASDDVIPLIDQVDEALFHCKKSEARNLLVILYIFYYTAVSRNCKYLFKCIFNKNFLIFRWPPRFTSYIMLQMVCGNKWPCFIY